MFAASLPLFPLKTQPSPSSSISFLNNKSTLLSPHSKCFHRSRLVTASHANISTELQQLIKRQTQTSTNLATHLLLSTKILNTNFIFSPLAIHAALRRIAADSKDNTLDDLLNFLNASSLNELYSVHFHLSTIFPNDGPGLGYQIYVDKTLSDKPPVIVFVGDISNYKVVYKALYKTKGTWIEEFNSLKTKECDFNLLDGNKVQVPFMSSNEQQYVSEYDGFKVLGIPHFQNQDNYKFSMYLFLPNENDGLQSLIQEISSSSDFIDSHIPKKKVEIGELLIPKFKVKSEFEASDVLKELGLDWPFEEFGLTEMVDSSGKYVYVSSLHHKSSVSLEDKKHTKSAATCAFVEDECSPMMNDKVDFVADHPFLVVMKEDVSGFVFFVGQVVDPSLKSEEMCD